MNLKERDLCRLASELIDVDHEQIRRMRRSVRGESIVPHKLDCDLLVAGSNLDKTRFQFELSVSRIPRRSQNVRNGKKKGSTYCD